MDEHQAANVEGATLVVASSAISPSNPEILAAQTRQIPIWPRAKMLGHLLEPYTSLVITGTHGKTTTTAMATQVLLDCGMDPTAFIGGEIPALGGNARIGTGAWAVAEGDESDGSFTYLHPTIALVNNIDADHLDFYPDLGAIIAQFKRFLTGIEPNGWILYSADWPACAEAIQGMTAQTLSYGFSAGAAVQGIQYTATGENPGCDVLYQGRLLGHLRLSLGGQANYHNALGILALAQVLNLPLEPVFSSLSRFTGVQRRMELKGTAAGVTVIDDYAHHPTEIKATIQALRERYPHRLRGVFQPHLYSRTQKLAVEFGQAFLGLDELVLMDIYPAREKPVPGMTGEILLEPIRQSGVTVRYLPNQDDIIPYLAETAQEGETVVTLGAGSVWHVGEMLLQNLQERRTNSHE
jgi:UDP-N-acetylmuramate--alanine ligase